MASRIRHFVVKFCESHPATARRPRATELWPGVCYFGAETARVVWMDDSDTYYDGKEGPLYSRESLDHDLNAGDLVVAAIRSPLQMASPDLEMNLALQHVHAAEHTRSEPRQDWLSWIVERLGPNLPPLNSRGKPKLKHRGVHKPKCACSRLQFAAKLIGLRGTDVTLLWRDHVKTYHK
jgi:hypothetical protein